MATSSNSKANKGKSSKPAAPVKAAAPAKAATKPAPAAGGPDPTPDEISIRAFEIYVSEGCQPGNDLENWLRAEQELRSQRAR
jgi:hypothetical protein